MKFTLLKSQDLFFTALNQLWKLFSGPITLILIPLFLSSEVQGYWFTIIGLSFLMIFADLGFSNITLQFAAHEFAYLRFDENKNITGDIAHLQKLATFFLFSIRWAITMVIAITPIIAFVSFFILSKNKSDINWFLPWFIYLIASVVVFLNNVLLYFFEGCDSVGLVQKIRFIVSVLISVLMWGGLILKFNLYALSLSLLLGAFLGSFFIYRTFKNIIFKFFDIIQGYSYPWGKHFFPLLWRYAVSFASGYFIFQLYTPLMFYYHGPIEAGKIGITVALWMAVYNISSVWIYSITPKINMHVSRKEWEFLDKLFFKRLFLTLGTFMLGFFVLFLSYFYFKGHFVFFDNILNRFADNMSMLFLAASWFLQTIINSLAVYLRAHKQEPLALPSFVSAVYITLTTFLCAKYFPPNLFFLGFFSSYLWGLPWILFIFSRKRKMRGS